MAIVKTIDSAKLPDPPKSIVKARSNIDSHSVHRRAALEWLKRAQDRTDDGGVSQGFYLRGRLQRSRRPGWRPSYVETSGYIIETFYDNADIDPELRPRAERIGRWLMEQQRDDGSFGNTAIVPTSGLVFDTGQVLFGLSRSYRETSDPVFRAAAYRAARWLSEVMDEDGAWRHHVFNGEAHTYNSRTAWAMLDYATAQDDDAIAEAAWKALNWSRAQQGPSGLFDHCAFTEGAAPYTHTIAYAIRGLFEGGLLCGDRDIIQSAQRAADAVADHLRDDGFLPSRISPDGVARGTSCCLTGNCQMAIIWFRMADHYQDASYAELGHRALGYVLRKHRPVAANPNIRGGVKGSHPSWGRYAAFSYPNWAAKFMVDALRLAEGR